ncbi:hypothetical protein Tcan_03353 [Toxocara canis]|uniref:Uncharacterized protein n=1 Tax=Toxocara canis TaxID=6265 RepID=A0A0B2W294_TOXCA|nr:hypothetical protein Tcan_03353 [Toxocara canis]
MFKKYGYLIDRIEWPFVKLKRQLNCSAVFEDWLAIANAHNASQEPPHEIPLDLVPQYTLNNLARHEKWYFSNNHYSAEPRNWTEQYIEQLVRNGSVPEESPYGPDGGMPKSINVD